MDNLTADQLGEAHKRLYELLKPGATRDLKSLASVVLHLNDVLVKQTQKIQDLEDQVKSMLTYLSR